MSTPASKVSVIRGSKARASEKEYAGENKIKRPDFKDTDLTGLDSYKNLQGQANRVGNSQFANLQLEGLSQQASQEADDLAKTQAGQLSMAQRQLASSGGLTSGARERLAQGGATAGLFARQRAMGGVADRRLGIMTQDEQDRLTAQGSLRDLETTTLAGNTQNRNAFNMQKYQQDMTSRADSRASTAATKAAFRQGK